MSDDYGNVELHTEYCDGDRHTTISRADPIIGITTELLGNLDPRICTFNTDGHLVILGQLTYRPVRFAEGGRVIVCERVSETTTPVTINITGPSRQAADDAFAQGYAKGLRHGRGGL